MTTCTSSRIRLIAGSTVALIALSACGTSATSGQAPGGSSSTTSSSGGGYSQPMMSPSQPMTSSTQPMMSSSSSTTSSSSTGGGAASDAALTLKMTDSALGKILVDGKGMTLYLFTKDSPNTSVCEGACLVNWPPLLGKPTVGAGVDDSKVGSFTRADGRVQATYNNWPLYYWANDAAPGDTTGQKVQGVWFVLDRDGDPIK